MHFETYAEARKELGRIATRTLKANEYESLNRILNLVYAEGCELRWSDSDRRLGRWDSEFAVKSKVTIGRCRRCDHGAFRRAFWFPKGEQRLADAKCPYCGHWLNQTTLALVATFERLPKA